MAVTIPEAFTRGFQQCTPDMNESARMEIIRKEVLDTMQNSVGIKLTSTPATLSTPINPSVNHFRRSIKNPGSTFQPSSTSMAGLSDPVLEEHAELHTPVRKPANPPSQGEPPKSKAVRKEEEMERKELLSPAQPDQEEEMHVDKPVAAKKKKKTFEIDPAEMAGISCPNDFPVTKSSKFFKGFIDAAGEDDDEQEEVLDLESAMMSEAASTMASPDSSANSSDDDAEIDYDDKGAVIDDEEEEQYIVNKETKQVKRKKEEPKEPRKKTQEPFDALPSEQDMATGLLLELERCMVPDIAQINMILTKEKTDPLNLQHRRLIDIWTSLFSSSWSTQEWKTPNIFVQRLNALYAKWTTKKAATPSYGRIMHLVDQLRLAPCCECSIQGGRLAKPDGAECYVSGVKATAANIKEFSLVHLTLQTKTGDVCKEVAFYCHQKYKKLITSLYFSLHNSSWVALMSSADKSVQDNVEANKDAFYTNCIETLQTLQTYDEML